MISRESHVTPAPLLETLYKDEQTAINVAVQFMDPKLESIEMGGRTIKQVVPPTLEEVKAYFESLPDQHRVNKLLNLIMTPSPSGHLHIPDNILNMFGPENRIPTAFKINRAHDILNQPIRQSSKTLFEGDGV